jgi:hypothetical protein
MAYLSIGAVRANAVFVSGLRVLLSMRRLALPSGSAITIEAAT